MVPLMFLTPAVVGIIALILYPFLFEIYLSFVDLSASTISDWKDFGYIQFSGLSNYSTVFSNPVLNTTGFWSLLLRTFAWTFIQVFFHVTGGFIVALALNKKMKIRGLYRTLILVPWAMPQVIAVLTWLNAFNPEPQFGFVNAIISFFAGSPQSIHWVENHAFVMVNLVNIWLGIPFMSVVILGGLQSINSEYYEAADIDGATPWQKFRFITVPLIAPVLTPAIILGILWTFNNVNVIYLMTGGGGVESADILVTGLYKAAFNLYRYSFSAAFAIIIFLILAVLSFAYMKITKRFEEFTQN